MSDCAHKPLLPSDTRLKTWIVDSDQMCYRQVEPVLHGLPAFQLLGQSQTIESALQAVSMQPADVILIDPAMPEGRGYWFIEHVSNLAKAPHIVLHSHFFGPHSVWLALKHRIRSCVSKQDTTDHLQLAFESILTGGIFYSRSAAAVFNAVRRSITGSETELHALQSEVFLLQKLAGGSGLKSAAHDLGLTYNKAYRQMRASMRRANLQSAQELKRYISRTGL